MSRIIEMAQEARLGAFHLNDGSSIEALEKFAALVGAAKKEECAKYLDLLASFDNANTIYGQCATLIRALGDEVQG